MDQDHLHLLPILFSILFSLSVFTFFSCTFQGITLHYYRSIESGMSLRKKKNQTYELHFVYEVFDFYILYVNILSPGI